MNKSIFQKRYGIPDGAISLTDMIKMEFNLSELEKAELDKDLEALFLDGENDWKKACCPNSACIFYCNQKLGERFFKVIISVNYATSLVDVNEFSELTIDEYLDSINFAKKLESKGFQKFKING